MHDAQVYRVYLKEAERLREDGAFIRRVVLDHELKREYQQFLQECNRGKSASDGRPDRTPEEIHRWAVEHELTDTDGNVQFPETRVSSTRTATDISARSTSRSKRCTTAAPTTAPRRRLDSVVTAPAPRVLSAPGVAEREGRARSPLRNHHHRSTGKSGGRTPDPRIIEELLR